MCEEFVCQFCNKVFKRPCALAIHERTCKQNLNRIPLTNHRCNLPHESKIGGWSCRFCQLKFRTRKELSNHISSIHSSNKGIQVHSKDLRKCSFCNKEWETTLEGYKTHERYCIENPDRMIPKSHSVSDKTRLRLSHIALQRFIDSDINIQPAFNKKACDYIDLLNEKMNWHLQHALNGGEVRVGPYHLDGYDIQLNIAFEYDEPRHNKACIKKHDIVKQNFIIKELGCKFYRYNEASNEFYEIYMSA